MARDEKLLARLRANPRDDWTIGDLSRIAESMGLEVRRPASGSHYVVVSRAAGRQMTLPYKRPIKPVYVKMLVALIDAHTASDSGGTDA